MIESAKGCQAGQTDLPVLIACQLPDDPATFGIEVRVEHWLLDGSCSPVGHSSATFAYAALATLSAARQGARDVYRRFHEPRPQPSR